MKNLLSEDFEVIFDTLKDRANTLHKKAKAGQVSKENISGEIDKIKEEIEILKKLYGVESRDEKRKYAALKMAIKALRKTYQKL